MGDIKKQRKKYKTPSHPWQKGRLEEEEVIVTEYALKNKKEVWKMQSKLKHFTSQAKELSNSPTGEAQLSLLLTSIRNLGLLTETATADDVLNLGLKDIMERRLQTVVYRKGLARSMDQARQFIVHKHIMVGPNVLSVPSYLVKKQEEESVAFEASSSLASPDHPERFLKTEQVAKQKKKAKPVEQPKGRGFDRRDNKRRPMQRRAPVKKETKK